MEHVFEWDELTLKLKRTPECPQATREENMQSAADISAIQGTDNVARETSMYRMAMKAYTLRDWYQPCRNLPGGYGPSWLQNPGPNDYRNIRQGIRQIASMGDKQRDVERLIADSTEAAKASAFKKHAAKVVAVEAFNEGNCKALLMGHAWLKQLNPEGDRAAILLLDGLMQDWFGIMEPELETSHRHRQAAHAAKNYSWLSMTWRDIWERP
jgi:hypothetical protein